MEKKSKTKNPVPKWKRSLDLLVFVITAPVWVPLSVLIALWVRAVSPGPALFSQIRVGRGGRHFDCLKFRSMSVNADPSAHISHLKDLIHSDAPMQKLDSHNDPRLIRGGRFLRSSGLDELPQLLNVLKGEMSIVGPRPCLLYEFEEYEEWQKERCEGMPGITGLWQVSGKNSMTFSKMVETDIRYLRNLSLREDLKIILKTFFVLANEVRKSFKSRQEESKKEMPAMKETHGEEVDFKKSASRTEYRIAR